MYLDGSAFGTDGTSWSGLEVTALLTETAQSHNGTRLGFANPAIYALFTSMSYADFYDITSGTNEAYQAVPGYDQVTGIGAPKGFAFAQAL